MLSKKNSLVATQKKDKPGFINILVTKLILRGICSIVNNTYLEKMLYA